MTQHSFASSTPFRLLGCALGISILALATGPVLAAESGGPTYLDPAAAGLGFAFQGEYEGTVGDAKIGGQIIDLGQGNFRGVFYPGGLPGDGWDGDRKIELDALQEGNTVVFHAKEGDGKAVLSGGKLIGKTSQGDDVRLRKIIRLSPTLGAPAPEGAIVLFNGTSADAWQSGHIDERHLLAPGTKSKQSFTNFTLHAEFLLPFKPEGRGQGRGNSGVYLQDRYEVQVLDSFGLKGENNECGAIYSQIAPSLNMCFPPLTWQTYDIDFEAAQFDADGKKTKKALATIKHNGVVIHDHAEISGPTGGGQPEKATGGPIQLQGHGNPVFYRNIWIIPR